MAQPSGSLPAQPRTQIGPAQAFPQRRAEPRFATIQPDEALRLIDGPTLVTMHLKDVEPRAVLDELTRQSGVRFFLQGLEPGKPVPKVTVNIDGTPFWTALQSVLQQSSLTTMPYPAGSRFTVVPIAALQGEKVPPLIMDGPSITHGPVTVTATQIEHQNSSSLTLGGAAKAAASDIVTLGGQFTVDPKLLISDSDSTCTFEEIRDDKGNSLLDPPREGEPVSTWIGALYTGNFRTQLKMPAEPGKRIALVRGRLHLLVATRWRRTRVNNVLDRAVQHITPAEGDPTVTLEEFKQHATSYDLTLSVNGPSKMLNEARQIIYKSMDLTDAQERPLQWQQSSIGSTVGNAQAIAVEYDRGQVVSGMTGEPAQLAFALPTEFKYIEVPFEFKDLPLP
jgi:hypothetical protein